MDIESIVLCVVIICIFIGIRVYIDKQYKKTAYYQVTQNSYYSMKHDKGQYGEYLTYKSLRYFENLGGKFLFNIYIPKMNNSITEIDVILICSKGIFVFESKNYSGWIFGNESHKNWTQTLPLGRGYSHKERFYNPIMQNAMHIKYLRRIVGETFPIHSVIVFSDRCILKDVTINSRNVSVINRYDIPEVVSQIYSREETDILNEIEINKLYNKLYPYTQINHELKAQHIEDIHRYKIG